MADLVSDWDAVHSPATDAIAIVNKRAAARRIAALAAGLPRVTVQMIPPAHLTDDEQERWFDLERLRTNVYHLVAPQLLRTVR